MSYEFIESNNGHTYALVQPGWLWKSKYDIYLDKNPMGKLDVSITYQGRKITSQYKSSADASRLVQILKKMGIKKEDLQKTKFPKETEQRVLNAWEHVLAWLFAVNPNSTLI